MIEYKYNKRENKFTENGHTMFEFDVLQRLKRLAYLEEQLKLLPIDRDLIKVENAYIEDADTVDNYDVTGRVTELWISKSEFDNVKCINN